MKNPARPAAGMKIVVAFDKFKSSLSATEACEIVGRALRDSIPGAHIVLKPMADGGEGTAVALHAALGGKWITRHVAGPLPGTRRAARYLWQPRERLAVVEMAQASGLALLSARQRNPLRTTTYGTGELLADAARRGARRIWLTVGGSATIDGGVGAAMALGWRFFDSSGRTLGQGGRHLERIARIESPARIQHFPRVTVLCDVDNPLCGKHGAARVFGPQKGATPAMVARLDAGLRNLAALAKSQTGRDILRLPGGGAAGGLAAGAAAFMNAELVPGIETVMAASALADELDDADWLITGEGQFDEQSLRGKVVAGVASLARKSGTKVAVLAGRVKLHGKDWKKTGVEAAIAITPKLMSTEAAVKRTKQLLFAAARKLAALL
jgi:glycerate kinase